MALLSDVTGIGNIGLAGIPTTVLGTATTITGPIDINAGTIDGTVIGGSTAAAGSFTTLGATGVATFSGDVGIGVNPSYQLDVYDTAAAFAAKIKNFNGSDAGGGLWIDTRWNTAGNRPLKITSNNEGTSIFEVTGNGNVGIGTNAPNVVLHTVDASGTAVIALDDSRSNVGDTASVEFRHNGITGSIVKSSAIEDFSVAANRSSDLQFWTRNNGTQIQAATIDASGNLLLGTTTIHGLSGAGAGTFVTALNDGQLFLRNSVTTAGKGWYLGADSSSVMQVYNQAGVGVTMADGATAWSATSDERLKDIIEPITDGLAKVRRLRSVVGKYKSDEDGVRRAFLIAQDVLAEQPEAVDQTNPDALALRSTEVIPLLVSALHDASDMIESLTARIEALEGA